MMKKLTVYFLIFGFISFITPLKAQSNDGHEALKNHINSVVENVKKMETTKEKREYLDQSLDELIQAMDRIQAKSMVKEVDKEALEVFKQNLADRKDELNGENGFAKVPGNQLNDYANFIQQDIEQADRIVTLSLTTALLIVLILLLL